jgi:hypothetical protein
MRASKPTETDPMPAKHIPDDTWEKVKDVAMEATIETKTRFKDSEILGMLLEIGMAKATEADYWKLAKKKNKQSA